MNYKVYDCHMFTKKEIKSMVEDLYDHGALGHSRSKHSYVKEWFAHKVLYNIGYKRERTKDVDLNDDESLAHRLGYTIIYLVCLGWL